MSQFIEIQNAIRLAMGTQPATVVDVTRDENAVGHANWVLSLAERAETPDSVECIQSSSVFAPETLGELIPHPRFGTSESAEPATRLESSRWRVLVQWSIKVDHMDWIRRIAYKGIHSQPGDPHTWVAEIQSCDTVLSPDFQAESGTRLLINIITRQR